MAENREKRCFVFFASFYPRISAFPAFSRIPNDRKLDLLSNGAVQSFWDALWLGIELLLCFMAQYCDGYPCEPVHIRFRRFGLYGSVPTCRNRMPARFAHLEPVTGSHSVPCETVLSLRFRFGSRL